jgi:group I intron endonuclease
MQVYKITNIINNKIYIGKDTSNNPNYFGSGILIKKSIKKYGIENFIKEIIEECNDNQTLCEKEKYWIKEYNSTNLTIGYNISKGGDGGDTFSNNPNKLEIKEKIRDSMKTRVFTEKHRSNLSKNHMSTKHKKGKTYEEIYGKERADEYKGKLRLSRQKYKTEKERLGENYDKVILLLSNRIKGDDNPMRKNKYLWYVNPLINHVTRIKEGDLIPEGYVRGRK